MEDQADISSMLLNVAKTMMGPVFSSVLYYYDLVSDAFNAYQLNQNCHKWYASTSVVIMITSYITTVLFLNIRLKKSLCEDLRYPYIHIKQMKKQIKIHFQGPTFYHCPFIITFVIINFQNDHFATFLLKHTMDWF